MRASTLYTLSQSSVSQLFHGPAPRSPLRRLSVRSSPPAFPVTIGYPKLTRFSAVPVPREVGHREGELLRCLTPAVPTCAAETSRRRELN